MTTPRAAWIRTSKCLLALAVLGGSLEARAQGSRADYERSAGLRRTTANKIFRDRVEPHWLPGNTRFWYEIATGPATLEYVLVDAEKGSRTPAFDHVRLAGALQQAGVADARPEALNLRDLAWTDDGIFQFTAAAKRWSLGLKDYVVLAQTALVAAPSHAIAPGDAPKASTSTGDETLLRFVNRTASEVEILWLDQAGAAQSYGRLAAGASREQHTYSGHVWLAADASGRRLAAFVATAGPGHAEITDASPPRKLAKASPTTTRRSIPRNRSPDGKWTASIKEHNVVLTATAGGRTIALTSDGTAANAYRERFFWSPDSTKLAGVRTTPGEERKVSFVESSPKGQVQPVLHTFNYYKPGDKLPHPRPMLWDLATEKPVPIDDALFPNPFNESGDLELRWERDSSRFVFRYNQRGHQVLRVIAIDAATGAAKTIVDEQSKTFITYGSGKAFSEWVERSGELIWASERDGWNHLYLYDAMTGRVKNQITRGEWVVRAVDRVDHEQRQIWFQAGGIVPGQDPYYAQYCRINFDGTGLVVLTEGDGTHALTLSPDRRYGIDRFSRVDAPATTTLRRTDTGKLVCALEQADASALLKTGWREPERFVAKGRDGVTDIYGVLVRPSNFDPAKKYPVLEHIYAGPQGAFVPKAFGLQLGMMEMAELGFVVVQIDGMGTNERSKAFHDVAWQNLADAGLPDRVLWIKAAAAKHAHLDLTRVGIYGGSAGGQNALGALLTHGDFYHVGAADCGCHDNRMDKIWWNEQWMGWPIGPHYAAQSNVTLAPRLQGKLLLIVGEIDRNVDPASTMQVANALIKADKDFDLLVMPGVGHGATGTPYAKRRQQDFFVRHLLNREPRW